MSGVDRPRRHRRPRLHDGYFGRYIGHSAAARRRCRPRQRGGVVRGGGPGAWLPRRRRGLSAWRALVLPKAATACAGLLAPHVQSGLRAGGGRRRGRGGGGGGGGGDGWWVVVVGGWVVGFARLVQLYRNEKPGNAARKSHPKGVDHNAGTVASPLRGGRGAQAPGAEAARPNKCARSCPSGAENALMAMRAVAWTATSATRAASQPVDLPR